MGFRAYGFRVHLRVELKVKLLRFLLSGQVLWGGIGFIRKFAGLLCLLNDSAVCFDSCFHRFHLLVSPVFYGSMGVSQGVFI